MKIRRWRGLRAGGAFLVVFCAVFALINSGIANAASYDPLTDPMVKKTVAYNFLKGCLQHVKADGSSVSGWDWFNSGPNMVDTDFFSIDTNGNLVRDSAAGGGTSHCGAKENQWAWAQFGYTDAAVAQAELFGCSVSVGGDGFKCSKDVLAISVSQTIAGGTLMDQDALRFARDVNQAQDVSHCFTSAQSGYNKVGIATYDSASNTIIITNYWCPTNLQNTGVDQTTGGLDQYAQSFANAKRATVKTADEVKQEQLFDNTPCSSFPEHGADTTRQQCIDYKNGQCAGQGTGWTYDITTDQCKDANGNTVGVPTTPATPPGSTDVNSVDCGGQMNNWWMCDNMGGLIANMIDWFVGKIGDGLRWNAFTDTHGQNVIFQLWQNFLPLGNILFAIVFLIMIYSVATSTGLNNFTIKKILPRLILVAIAMNVSFYICAFFADVSNIVGDSVSGTIASYATGGMNGDGLVVDKWQSTLGDLASVAGAIIAVMIAGVTAVLALILIIALIGLRQAVLIVLVILSPVAIALALLPNTEKAFKFWLNNYLRMLLIYPAFMIVWAMCRVLQVIMIAQ